ncbi:MAG: hypothetical protein RAK24_04420 [TACK group archaeon]|nr:hypothetical protein [TACK group archaeon]
MSRASLEEEVYLRALTGRLVGQHLFEGMDKVLILSHPDRICESISAAAIVAFFDRTGYGEGRVKVLTFDGTQEIGGQVLQFKPDGVYLAFGGEERMTEVGELTIEALKQLMAAGYAGSLLIHVRVWLATKQLSFALSQGDILAWLKSLREIRVFTADASARKFSFFRVKIADGKTELYKYAEEDITQEHADLLKRSLPPPRRVP